MSQNRRATPRNPKAHPRNGKTSAKAIDTRADAKRVGDLAHNIAMRAGLKPKAAAINRKIWEEAFIQTYL
jgi:hypothetical protein